ncbi:MAG: SMC-Scp complex subunit ScpB [Gammaproteobacteria bacterium]|nr:SMC-Scp complex subunit ScpB [Gammaproteobacteria bacterium]
MNEHYLRNVIEAALLAAGRPVQAAELMQLFDENARPTMEQLRAAIDALAADYGERGIELKETASGVRIQVRRELAGEVSRLWPERPARYSRALLETLALIAYRQPITRGEIEAVRGVAVNPNIVKTLLERNWVRVVGTRDVPGRPELLGTTRDFLDYFGLKSLDELPPLSELKAVGDFNLQLDLQGDAARLAANGEAAGAAPAPPGAAAAAESAGESAAASAQAAAESQAPATGAAEPSSDEALLEAGESTAEADNTGEDDEAGEEGDELSAEGGDSRELVAAPRNDGD